MANTTRSASTATELTTGSASTATEHTGEVLLQSILEKYSYRPASSTNEGEEKILTSVWIPKREGSMRHMRFCLRESEMVVRDEASVSTRLHQQIRCSTAKAISDCLELRSAQVTTAMVSTTAEDTAAWKPDGLWLLYKVMNGGEDGAAADFSRFCADIALTKMSMPVEVGYSYSLVKSIPYNYLLILVEDTLDDITSSSFLEHHGQWMSFEIGDLHCTTPLTKWLKLEYVQQETDEQTERHAFAKILKLSMRCLETLVSRTTSMLKTADDGDEEYTIEEVTWLSQADLDELKICLCSWPELTLTLRERVRVNDAKLKPAGQAIFETLNDMIQKYMTTSKDDKQCMMDKEEIQGKQSEDQARGSLSHHISHRISLPDGQSEKINNEVTEPEKSALCDSDCTGDDDTRQKSLCKWIRVDSLLVQGNDYILQEIAVSGWRAEWDEVDINDVLYVKTMCQEKSLPAQVSIHVDNKVARLMANEINPNLRTEQSKIWLTLLQELVETSLLKVKIIISEDAESYIGMKWFITARVMLKT